MLMPTAPVAGSSKPTVRHPSMIGKALQRPNFDDPLRRPLQVMAKKPTVRIQFALAPLDLGPTTRRGFDQLWSSS